MWRVVFLTACVATFHVALSSDYNEATTSVPITKPGPTTERSCGCGGGHPICDENEEYDDCEVTFCRALKCSELGFPLNCDNKCEPGCKCKDGYVWNDKGVCIPVKTCPSCGGDKNAESGCGTNCNKTCASLGQKPPIGCPKICYPNSCDCRDGFYYDPKQKKCVKKEDCKKCPGQNEYYEKCINNCGSQNCSDRGKIYHCPNIVPGKCDSRGCRCKPGYLRDAKGVCVLEKDCPTPDCPYGEVWNPCPTVPCEGDNCAKTKDSPQSCPTGIVCSPARCVCGYNRKRAKNGTCVLITDCPPFKCGKNETYVACSSNCPGENCSDYINQTKCPKYRIGIVVNCKPACKCKKGYYRDKKGNCILACDCTKPPPKCGKNEVYDDCSSTSCKPTLCSQLGYPLKCDKECKPGCKCKDGYVHNDKGVCIPIKNCPSCGGDKNAVSGCGTNCGKTCASLGQKPPIVCPKICKLNSCDCRDGFYYDPNQKKCVKKEDCTPTCKVNEIYSTCINGGCGHKNCSQINKPIACVHPKICKKGCICKEGYLRADNGTCIPKDQCPKPPPKCGKNEVYDNCSSTSCKPTLCSQLGYPLKCDKKCKPGCKCKDGYVRNDKGVCIPIKNCPSCGGDKNAVSGCGTNCGKTCALLGQKPPFVCPKICKLNSCDCRDGFYYDPNQKKCVKKEDCTPTCKVNEIYSNCINGGCGPKNCSQINKPIACAHPKICKKGCICKKGYLRAINGTCIPKDQCPQPPPKCGKNEVYDNCSSTSCKPTLCSQLGYPLKCDKKCKPGCKCKDGYVRNDKGVCIPIKNCPSCGGDKNAVSGCGTNCGKTCASLGQKPPIVCPLICKLNSCDCRDGFYYDPNQKKCVKKEDCTRTCKENEIYSTCINGGCYPRSCSEINQSSACVEPEICKKGCICKKGYLRADNGTCIPKDQCPQNCPGQNEYYEKCITNCGSQNCSDRGKIYHCPKIVPGKCDSSGCRCKPGYLRDAKGVCILKKDCPPPSCPKGEVWEPCPTVPCKGDNCPKTKDSPQSCPTGIVCSPPRCICGYNRKRAENGTCILITDCPPFKCGKNETYVACPQYCPGENCSDYINQKKCPPIRIGIIVNCKPACKCKKGYYRDEKGNCILACDCTQPPPKCGKNEVYDDCSSTSCKPTRCSELGYPLKCDKKCKPGCKCKDGYVRNDKGVCIPIKNCPSCGGDKNAVSGCGTNCGKTCASLGQKPPIVCPLICKLNSCDCRDGFYYDPNQKKCVKKEDCTRTCKENEIYSTCINGGCYPRSCSEINQSSACVEPAICKKGCICKKGYLRTDNGTCIPKDQCPQNCPGKNEYYEKCIHKCGSQNCSDKGKIYHCPIIVPGKCDSSGCLCKPGYLRDDKGICIPEKDCPPICPDNEVYSPCANGGCGPKNCSQVNDKYICIDPICIKGCVCKDGYLRNDVTGKCVPKDQCPKTCPGQNEYYEKCINNCGSQNCSDRGKIYDCPKIVPGKCDSRGCRCKTGYLRDAKGVCVLEKDCPSPDCPYGEKWDKCPTVPCEGDKCPKTKDSPQNCPTGIVCSPPRCVCGYNRKRAENGSCILITDCPPFKCGKNEMYVACSSNCPGEKCSDYINQTKCPPFKIGIIVNCKPACKCKKGYYRDVKGNCILACDCPVSTTTTPKPTRPPCGCEYE